jgi:hypothetical protein
VCASVRAWYRDGWIGFIKGRQASRSMQQVACLPKGVGDICAYISIACSDAHTVELAMESVVCACMVPDETELHARLRKVSSFLLCTRKVQSGCAYVIFMCMGHAGMYDGSISLALCHLLV